MAAAANWESDICGCCSVKDCGCGCCCKLYCTGPCIWGAAIERAGLGSMPMCCIAVTCCSPCAIIKGRMDVAEKYGIKENLLMNVLMTCCCEPCSCIQVINQVHFSPVPPCPITSKHFVLLPDVPVLVQPGLLYSPASPLPPPTPAPTATLLVNRSLQNAPQILVKENSTWGCCGVETSANGAPAIETMER